MCARVQWRPDMGNLGPAVVCIGKFDGVHVGHTHLIDETVRRARAAHTASLVMTFDRHPADILAPGAAPGRILPVEENLRLIEDRGPSHLIVLPFTEWMAGLSARRFMEEVLLTVAQPLGMVVGEGFRFGAGAEAGADELRHGLAATRCEVVELPLRTVGGLPVASTRIRNAVAAGDVDLAGRLLGRAHAVSGEVVEPVVQTTGSGLAHQSVTVDPGFVFPAGGLYTCVVHGAAGLFSAVAAPVCGRRLIRLLVDDVREPLSGRVTIEWYARLTASRRVMEGVLA